MRKFAGATLGVLLAGGAVFVGVAQIGTVGPAVVATGAPCDATISTPAPSLGSPRALALRSSDSLTVALVGNARRCPSSTVTVYVREGAGAETTYDTATTSATGAWSKSVVVTDGVSTRIRAAMTVGGRSTDVVLVVDANTALPKLAVNSPVPDGSGVLRVVAPAPAAGCGGGGNAHTYLLEPGWLGDADCAAGGQVATSVVVTGAAGGTLTISYDGVELSSSSVTASPQTFTPTLTLPDHTRADLVFAATNGSGTTTATYLVRVMTSIPPALVGPDGGAVVTRVVDSRAAIVELEYLLPVIPAAIESASIEVQWTTGLRAYSDSPVECFAAPNWAPLTVYPLQQWVRNGANIYLSATAGTSAASGGPTGTGQNITDGTARWNWMATGCRSPNAKLFDGGLFDPAQDGGGVLDPGVFLLGDSAGTSSPPIGGQLPGTSKGLVYRHPDVCVLYEPAASPQLWECADGQRLESGAVHRARLSGLPPQNTYYFWTLVKY